MAENPYRSFTMSVADLPSHVQKFVIWRTNGDNALVYLVGYCPDTLAYFLGMFLDAQKVMPGISPDDAMCTKVKQSDCHQGFTMMIIAFSGPKRDIPGFKECSWNSLRIESY